jgi:hypothetical protein
MSECAGKALLDAKLQLINGREEQLRIATKEWTERFQKDLCCIKTSMIEETGSLWWKRTNVIQVPLYIHSHNQRWVGEGIRKNVITIKIHGNSIHDGDWCWFSDYEKCINIRLNNNGVIEGRFDGKADKKITASYDGCLEAVIEMVANHIKLFCEKYGDNS